jgi:predicted RNase H-like HicB family nuclease
MSNVGPHFTRRARLRKSREKHVKFKLECELEDDGRWLAEVSQLPGVLAYGASANEAMAKAEVLALRVLAEQLEHGEVLPLEISIFLPAAA